MSNINIPGSDNVLDPDHSVEDDGDWQTVADELQDGEVVGVGRGGPDGLIEVDSDVHLDNRSFSVQGQYRAWQQGFVGGAGDYQYGVTRLVDDASIEIGTPHTGSDDDARLDLRDVQIECDTSTSGDPVILNAHNSTIRNLTVAGDTTAGGFMTRFAGEPGGNDNKIYNFTARAHTGPNKWGARFDCPDATLVNPTASNGSNGLWVNIGGTTVIEPHIFAIDGIGMLFADTQRITVSGGHIDGCATNLKIDSGFGGSPNIIQGTHFLNSGGDTVIDHILIDNVPSGVTEKLVVTGCHFAAGADAIRLGGNVNGSVNVQLSNCHIEQQGVNPTGISFVDCFGPGAP